MVRLENMLEKRQYDLQKSASHQIKGIHHPDLIELIYRAQLFKNVFFLDLFSEICS